MGLFDHFPYTNVHELNLDWVLSMMKALEAEWDAFTAGNSLQFADPMLHDISKSYAKNTIVLDGNGNAYVSLQAVPVGVGLQNGDYWLMVFDYEAFIEKVNKNFTARYYRGSYRATAAMAIGDWLTVDDVLCKATAAIAIDDVLEVGVNIEHFTLEDFIKAFMQSANQLILQYKNDIDASEAAYRQQLADDISSATASLQAQLDAAISGVTVDSEVINARVGYEGTTFNTLGDAIRGQFDIVTNFYSYFDKDYFTEQINSATIDAGYLQTDGTHTSTASTHSITLYDIPVIAGMIFEYEGEGDYNAAAALFYNAAGTIIGYEQTTGVQKKQIVIPDNCVYATFSSYRAVASPVIFRLKLIPPRYHFNKSTNLINPAAGFNGYIAESAPSGVSNDSYRSSGYIEIKHAGTYLCYTPGTASLGARAGRLYIYDSDLTYNSYIDGTEISPKWYSYTLDETYLGKYVRKTTGGTTYNNFYFGFIRAAISPIPTYGEYLDDDVRIKNDQIVGSPEMLGYKYNSPLTGKVWYIIGDSSSHGDFSGITQPNISDGMYANRLPVYPFFIGNRTGMIVNNIAQNGATAAVRVGETNYQWTDASHYTLVGNDADYITLWIGANDMWYDVPLGTINSTDTSTFMGAMNVMIDWYINYRPDAKLGIVVSYWLNATFAQAVKDLAAKYGIPTLNFYDDPSVPVSVGSQRPDVDASIKTLRDTQYRVSAGNAHASATYHELESYFIESWLLTL